MTQLRSLQELSHLRAHAKTNPLIMQANMNLGYRRDRLSCCCRQFPVELLHIQWIVPMFSCQAGSAVKERQSDLLRPELNILLTGWSLAAVAPSFSADFQRFTAPSQLSAFCD